MSNHEGRVFKPKRQRPRVPKEDRLRATRACQQQRQACQRSKHRCIEPTNPTGQCIRCQRKSLPCVYPGQDAITLTSPSGSTGVASHPVDAIQDSDWEPFIYTPPKFSSTVRVAEGPVGISAQQHSVPSLEEPSISPEALNNGSIDFSTDRLSGLLSRIRHAMFLAPSGISQENEVTPSRSRSSSSRRTPSLSSHTRRILQQLPPRSVADFLCSCAFELGTDSFFYMCQHEFKSKLNELYSDEASPLSQSYCFICLVLMTFALGSQFAHLRPSTARSRAQGKNQSPGLFFFNLASPLIPEIIASCSVEAMQACFVMSVYLLPEHAYDQSYFYMGLALRIAVALNLHRQKSGSFREMEIRHRLWWSIYSLERTVSLKLGRPRAIAVSDINIPLPQPLVSLDDIQEFDNIQHQTANAKLVLIMDQFTQSPAYNSTTQHETLDTLEKTQENLQKWQSSLPSSLQIYSLVPGTLGHRAVVHLHLNQFIARILLTRASLLFVVRQHLKRLFGNPEPEATTDNRVEKFAGHCVEAARNIIGLFESLQQTQSLGMFSFTDFQGCSTATVILLLDSMLHNSTTHSSSISAGLSCLRYMAIENQQAKIGVRFVEEFKSIADEVLMNGRQTQHTEMLDLRRTDVDAYEQWASNLAPAIIEREGSRQSRSHELTPSERGVTCATPNPPLATPIFMESVEPGEGSVMFTIPDQMIGAGDDSDSLHQTHYDSLPSAEFDDSLLLGLTGLDTLDGFFSTYME